MSNDMNTLFCAKQRKSNVLLTTEFEYAILIATRRCSLGVSYLRDYLVKLRNERNETQQNVADAVGLSRQYYAMIESGNRQKKMDIILATSLATHFGITLAEMIALEQSDGAEEDSAQKLPEAAGGRG
jgi:DNA-binding XRE family transcriptional regulator